MEKASRLPTTTMSLGNGPLRFSNPPLSVIPSEAEGSAVYFFDRSRCSSR
jgi:hypothetical protein